MISTQYQDNPDR